MLGVSRCIPTIAGVMMSSEFMGNGCLGCVVRKKKTFLGCTGISSLAKGHGARAVHCRFRYRDRRDESSAAGFAELERRAVALA